MGILFPYSAFAMTGTVLSGHTYAWSDNIGYVNFENVTVADSALTGFAWSTNKGFIKLNPSVGGVHNDGQGHLSGSAWGEQLGWIDFGNVVLMDRQFTGTATGDLIGTLTFECPTYCDVQTNWQTEAPQGGPGNVAASRFVPPVEPEIPHVEAIDVPLIVTPEQSGDLVVNTPVGEVIVHAPISSLPTDITYVVVPEPLTQDNQGLILDNTVLVNDNFFNVITTDVNGDPVEVFNVPLTVTLPLDPSLTSVTGLGVYVWNEINQKWSLIPDAVFTPTTVTFETGTSGKFAVFGGLPEAQKPPSVTPVSPPSPVAHAQIPKSSETAPVVAETPVPVPPSFLESSAAILPSVKALVPAIIPIAASSAVAALVFIALRAPWIYQGLWSRLLRLFGRRGR